MQTFGRRPNILIFMTDHQRGDTALAAHPVFKPNLRGMARQGLTFTNAFCPAPHCCPSRATFHTGLYPSQHGVWNNVLNEMAINRGLRNGVRCWSEELAAAGYELFFSGKWHVSALETPRDREWRELHVTATGAQRHGPTWSAYRAHASDLNRATRLRSEGEILRPGYGLVRLYGTRPAASAPTDDEIKVEVACDRLARCGTRRTPWAMFVGLDAPHDPYVVPARYLDRYPLRTVRLPESFSDTLADKPRIYQRMRRQLFNQLSRRETVEAIRHYYAYCTWIDDLFGKILGQLDRIGQAANTLVIFCSDHGDYCGDHGLFAKGVPCFRGAYHVPAVVRWPAGIIKAGRCVDAFVSLADFCPTVLELAGLSAPAAVTAGASLVPFMRNRRPRTWRNAIHTQLNGVELYYTQRSIVTRRWKYVFNGFDRDELYDLHRDPDEMRNLAALPAYRPVMVRLCREMWRFAATVHDPAINNYITVGLAPVGPAAAFAADHSGPV